VIVPGAKRPIFGNLPEFNLYLKEKETQLLGAPLKWIQDNIGRFAGKKDEKETWNPVVLMDLV